jgi:Ca-activated chloride channel family protein
MTHAQGRLRRVAVWMALGSVIDVPLSIRAQEPWPSFRTGVAVVPITAVVRDARNRIVRDLTRDDFRVFENGLPRAIVDFSSTDHASVSIGLLFDTSGSMRGLALDNGLTVVEHLLSAIDRTIDEVALFTFDKTVCQKTPFTNDAGTVRRALRDMEMWGLTSLYDAIAETASHLEGRPSQRRAVVVITDGLDTSSAITAPEVSGLASAIDVPVYVFTVVPPRRSDDRAGMSSADDDLANLAYWTGGDVRHVTAAEHATRAVGGLMAELRQQYVIAIESSTAGGWQRLDVRTRRRGLHVRARSGYFATPRSLGAAGGQPNARTTSR